MPPPDQSSPAAAFGPTESGPGADPTKTAQPVPPEAPTPDPDAIAWDRLLDRLTDNIQDGNVVAIVGAELSTIDVGGRQVPLYPHLLQLLEGGLRLPPRADPRRSLHEVICDHLQADPRLNRTEDVLTQLCRIYGRLGPTPSPALGQLAEIRGLKLFVTTTPDTLLETAINQVRFNGRSGVSSLLFSLWDAEDLPYPYEKLREPVVFHPFGTLVPKPNRCVLSDEDLLEFLYCLQGAGDRLPRLLDALRENQLLFIGNTFADWIMRFFLRTARERRLAEKKQRDYVVGRQLASDPNLVRFLQLFAPETIIPVKDPVTFVTDLRNKWVEKFPPPPVPVDIAPAAKMPDGAIFLSYAHEDRERVRRVKTGLEAAGLVVWFDVDQLMGGDEWCHKITENLARCWYFLPCISQNTEAAQFNRFFREEWRQAADITRRNSPDYPFVVPLLLDDLAGEPKSMNEEFPRKQMVRLLNGEVSDAFRQRMKELVQARRRERHDG